MLLQDLTVLRTQKHHVVWSRLAVMWFGGREMSATTTAGVVIAISLAVLWIHVLILPHLFHMHNVIGCLLPTLSSWGLERPRITTAGLEPRSTMAGLEPRCQTAYLPQWRHSSPSLYAPCTVLIMPERKYLCKSWPSLVTPGWGSGTGILNHLKHLLLSRIYIYLWSP